MEMPRLLANALSAVPWLYVAVLTGWACCMNAWALPLYQYVQSMCGSFIAGPGLSILFHLCFYHAAAALHALMDAYPAGPWAQFKVHRKDAQSYADLVPTVLFNQTLVYGATAAGVYWLTGGRGQQLLLYSNAAAPTALQYTCHCVAHYLLYETWFYWSHRALHHRALFPYHRMHHTTQASLGISGLYCSPLDMILTQALPVLLPPAILGTHVFVIWMYTPIVARTARTPSQDCPTPTTTRSTTACTWYTMARAPGTMSWAPPRLAKTYKKNRKSPQF
jgi:sterol desaturase/sphingolipid hydroxylase (fatty acid hydroxylase superfamily)